MAAVPLPWFNLPAFQFMRAMATPWLNSGMQAFTDSFYVVLPVIAAFLLLRRDKNVYSFAIAVVALYILSDLLKNIFMEPRPCSVSELSWINSVGCESTYGFPSNHATVLAGLPLFLGNHKVLRVLYIVWLAVVLFSRVYLGQHYLTDVIAGIIISFAVSYLIYRVRGTLTRIGDWTLKLVGLGRLNQGKGTAAMHSLNDLPNG